MLLVHFLRDTLGLTGTHVGCDTSNCGACTVHVDGVSVKSCTLLAVQADGARASARSRAWPTGTDLHPLQEGFWAEHGLQCGYCTPGMIMAAADLLERNPDPSEDEIRDGLAGNLCRCTGYHNIVKAVQHAAQLQQARPRPRARDDRGRQGQRRGGRGAGAGRMSVQEANGKHVGRRMRRKEDPPLIAGKGNFVDDIDAARHALGGVRALARGARHDHLDRHVGRARARRASRPSTPAPTSTSRRRSRSPGCRPASTSPRRRTGRWPRTPSSTSATRSRSSSARTATPSSTPPRTSSSTTTRCRSSSIPRRRSRAATSCTPDLGSNKVHEWSLGGDVESRAGGRRRRDRAPLRQPPHRGRADRAARRDRRLPRRRADDVERDAGAALPAPVPRPPARHDRGPRARDRARRRRRLRLQAADLRRGDPARLGRRASSAGRSSGSRRGRRTWPRRTTAATRSPT